MHIGKKIKLGRVAKGMTQSDLAEKINKTRPLISHIELSGDVNHYTLQKISEILDLNLEAIETAEKKATSKKQNLPNDNQDYIDGLINSQKQEIESLKELINIQRELIEILKKGKTSKS